MSCSTSWGDVLPRYLFQLFALGLHPRRYGYLRDRLVEPQIRRLHDPHPMILNVPLELGTWL